MELNVGLSMCVYACVCLRVCRGNGCQIIPPHDKCIALQCLSMVCVCLRLCVRHRGNGCQIIPPHDEGIAAAINTHLDLWTIPDTETLKPPVVKDPTNFVTER